MQLSQSSLESSDPPESSEIIAELVSAESRVKLEVVQQFIEPCDRATYGKRLQSAADKLNCSTRTVQLLVKKWEEEGLAAFAQDGRQDKGRHRISEDWQKFIIDAYGKGKCTPAQVAIKVKNEARAKGQDSYPALLGFWCRMCLSIHIIGSAKEERAT